MSSCTYKFKNASGEEVTITGQAEMKAFLANGGLEQLLPGKVLPWRGGSVAAPAESPKVEAKPAAIDDFGTKLEGARKDAQASMAKEWTDDEIASQPFSKVWPAADIDAIEDPFEAALMFAARAEVPAKPRVAYKVKAWVAKVKMFRDVVLRDIGNLGRDRALDEMSKRSGLSSFSSKVKMLEALDRSQWKRIGTVSEYPDAYTFNADGTKTVTPMVVVEIDGKREKFEGSGNVLDALDKINEKLGVAAEPKKMAFEVRGTGKLYFINKKGDKEYRKLKTFDTSKEAFAYIKDNYDDLVAAWEVVKDRDNVGKGDVRNETNRPRTGSDWRGNLSKARALQALINSAKADAKFVSDSFIRVSRLSHGDGDVNVPRPFGSSDWPSLPGGVNPKLHERLSYMAAVSIHLLRNLSEAESFGVELLGKGNVPLISAVQEAMLALGHDDKVLRSVVERIPVDVMDFLSREKISAESLFRDKSVLQSFFPVEGSVSIRAGVRDNPIVRLVREIARGGAEVVGADDTARIALEDDSALLTGQFNSGLEKSLFSHDVTPDEFDRTFSFKGVQFGNWVSQGSGGKDRQGLLNQAYDALMDLANIVGVPPKAISLNGSLGLAFGARGSGNASAHFEPSNLVINLTKTKGAGTLAHEWFHALDNYFSRQRGGEVKIGRGIGAQESYRTQNYITYRPEPMYVHKTKRSSPVTRAQLERYHEKTKDSDYYDPKNWQIDPAHPQGVRPEVERAFADLVEALDNSPMKIRSSMNDKGADGYWSRIIERGARAFENYVIHKMRLNGYDNDYLANVRKVDDFPRSKGRYPYLLDEEVAPVAEAFDNLFAEVKTKETDQGVAMFRTDVLPDTLTIDGVERPTKNSKGQPIHPTEEGLRNFWRWFGDSRAVDDQGRPLVVYHGTGADFDRFDLALVGRTFGAAGELGFFFSSNPETASKYAMHAGHGGGGNVIPAYVIIKSPIYRSDNFLRGPIGFLDWNRLSLKKQAEANRNDGVLIQQKEDGEIHESIVVAFRPEQIKSATGNTGAFDPANPDIRFRNDYPDTQAFREWFGNSKMTNKAGEPLLFMHGSPASFEAFDSSKLGTSSSHTSSGLGHFFTRDRATAEKYADGGNIYTGWLKIEKPYVMMLEEAQAFDDAAESAKRRAELQKQGYDGAVILDDEGKPWATVAFEPWQFKSTDNNGSFDEFDDRMRFRDDPSSMRDAPAVPRDQAEEFIRKFVAEYPGAPQIMLADSFYQLPEDIQSDALEQGSGPTRAKGALKNGKAYVVLNTHTSMADLEASVFHEVLGHAGIRKLLGPAFAQELNKMFIGLGGYSKLYQIMSRRGMGRQFEGYYDAVQRAREKNPEVWTEFLASSILTEEVFAHIAEQKNGKALRDRFMALVGMVRDWLRRNGFARLASLGESDIVFLLQRARAGLKNGSGVIRDGVTVGETVIVDAEGRPVAKKGSPDYEMLKAVSERMGLRETNGPTVFSNSLPEEGKPGDDARMDDANNVAGKQAPTPAGDVETGGAKPRYTARDWQEWSELPEFQNDDESTVLFNHGHGGYIKQVENGKFDTFDGIFALRAPGMVERGPDVTAFRIPDDKMLSQRDLNYDLDPDEVTSALLDVFPRKIEQGEESFDEAWKAIVEDRSDFESLGLEDDGSVRENSFMDTLGYSADDAGEASWFAQKLRGRLAQKLGYQAVEMDDENGTSWYIVPGVKSIPLPNESPASASSDAPTVFRTVTPEQLNAYAQPRGTVAREAFNNVVSAFKQPSAKVFGALHKTIATQLHKAWVSKDYAKVFGLADAYERDISRFSADPATVAPNLLPSFDSLAAAAGRMIHGNKNAKIMDGVAEAIIAGTLAGEDVTSGRVWTDAELRNQFGLSEQQVGLYKESRAAIDASLDAAASGLAWQMVKNYIPTLKESVRAETGNAETIIDGAMRELEEELREIARFQQTAEREGAIPEGTAAKTIKKAKDVAEARAAAEGIFLRADALKTAGYAPLMRFGKYAVDVVETLPDGTQERLGFYKFETEIEAKFAADALKKKHPEADVSRSVMSEEAWKLYRGVDPELVSLFADKIDGLEGLDVQNEVLQEWYRSAVNDRSAFKRMIQRKGVEGFERDITRVVASFITSNARVAARQFNMGDISKEIADMQARKVSGDVVDEAVKLKEYMENPTEPFQGLKGWMFAWFLGGSVASAALNMTQPLMMTLPYLSQFGGRKAAASLAGATKEAMSGNVSDPELKRALARAAKDGKVDPQQVHHLYHEGMSSFLSKLPLGAGARERAQGFMTLWGYMFGAVENFNRRITFIAAYRMAKNDPSLGSPYDFAVKAIDETQGIYNKANRPNWARGTGPFGAIGVAAFTFKQYSIGYIELLVRMAKSGRNGKLGAAAMLGLLVMLSGLQGFPGADDMEDIIDTVSQHLGYTGNSKLAIRNKLREVLGEEAGNVAMNGVLSLLPFDIGSRVGLGNMLPASAIAKPSEQNRGAQLAELFGPPLSMANQVIDASLAVESGGGAMSVAKVMAPVAFKNLMAAYDMADSGVYRDTRGRKVTDVSLADAMFKAGGFQPMSVSKEQKGARLVEMTGQRIRMVKAAINGMKARAIVENDNDLRQRAEAMRLDWNSKNPEAVIMPDAPSVMRRVKEMNTERRARLMKSLPKEYRRVAEGEMN